MMKRYDYNITGEVAKTYDLEFARSHYNIYPWIAEDEQLLRVLRLPEVGTPYLARVGRSSRGLRVQVFGDREPSKHDKRSIRDQLAFCLGLDADYGQLEDAATDDPVLAAALATNQGIRPKRYGDVFEAVCGAICAQNVDFRRLYQMMQLLATGFGPEVEVQGTSYWAFPQAGEVADASVEALRECKVGYRAQRILKAAQWFSANASTSDVTARELGKINREVALERVCQIPGIGPYSAAIVLSAGAGRQDIFHLDSFTRHILHELYHDTQNAADDDFRQFVDSKWPGFGGSVAHVLTTNTEIWAKRLGHEGFRRSGARR